jgi:hypothetical protein
MASSGTYAFAPDNADFVEEAFERCGIDPATLGQRHFRSAMRSTDLLFSHWSSLGARLFQMDEQTQTLTDGDPSYTAASGTLAIVCGVIRRSGVDTPVHSMSHGEYHLMPNKTMEGMPNRVWLDRSAGTYYLWPVPENSTDVYRYRRLRRIQDAGTGLQTPDLPYHWFEALAAGLAEHLALKFAPDRHSLLKGLAEQRFLAARSEDRERTDTEFDVG